jgi:hypothetical protein
MCYSNMESMCSSHDTVHEILFSKVLEPGHPLLGPCLKRWGPFVRKTSHTAHKGGSRELSHVQKFNKQAGGWEKMVQQLLSAGLILNSIWGKARARDGLWSAKEETSCRSKVHGWEKEGGWEVKNGGLCFARSETSCGLGSRRGSSHHFPIFRLLERERRRVGYLGVVWSSSCFRLAGGQRMSSGGVPRVWCLRRG